jgi:Domain of unknown function (DUF6431)
MSQNRLPPSPSYYEACLIRVRSSTQKGGTIIAEEVTDHVTHERCIRDPDGYRRGTFCARCGGRRLHVHDYRERVLRAESGKPVITIVRLVCVACEAIWQILPLFVARHLWRTWEVVRRLLMPDPKSSASERQRWPKVPPRTVRRWRQRWLRPVLLLAQILAISGSAWAALAIRLPVDATCADLVAAYAADQVGEPLAGFAALLYRLQPKVRLM